MNIKGKMMQAYFNYAYNAVYDLTTGRLNRYRRLQKRCVSKFEFNANDRVLCVGVGTGNEVLHILRQNKNVNIVGVDYSHTALDKAYAKALALGTQIEVFIMDARRLQFPTGSFDQVLCIHLMDFVEENESVTSEIVRVLKDGGQFVITYPSRKEGPMLGLNLLKEGMLRDTDPGKSRIKRLLASLGQMVMGFVYLPLLFRPHRKSYFHDNLETMISQQTNSSFQIEEDPVYQDFIVYGEK
jgi:ubiquinone/menaquinone biosynthesis C-methylase UbiE